MGIPTGWELLLLLGVLVLLFGATKLPMAARSLGQSLRIFKAETKGLRSDDDETAPAAHRPATAAPQQALPPSAPRATTPIEEPQRGNDTRR